MAQVLTYHMALIQMKKNRGISKISEVQYIVLNNLLTTFVINKITNSTYMQYSMLSILQVYFKCYTIFNTRDTNSQGDCKESLQRKPSNPLFIFITLEFHLKILISNNILNNWHCQASAPNIDLKTSFISTFISTSQIRLSLRPFTVTINIKVS